KKIKEEVGIDMPIISAGDDWSKVDYSKYECLNYLDDFSFSSKLVGDDIINFIEVSGVENVTIRIVLFVAHTHGMFDLKRRLTKFIANREKEKGKKINISFIFNKQFWELISNSIADDMTSKSSVYLAERELADSILLEHGLVGSDLYTPNVFRVGNHRGCILGDDDDRRRIERIFISKGLYIASHSNDLSRSLKPLGFYSYPGFGFGGNAFSYRNCPNNTPLVFWWGTYTKTGNSAIDCWYPLMKRTGYQL
ncbi:TPA: hypothetical protein LAO13_004531, partial [Escherichia coli]|nr:hypothetical protein [Escherichia coli]